jgi:hypothetical protein
MVLDPGAAPSTETTRRTALATGGKLATNAALFAAGLGVLPATVKKKKKKRNKSRRSSSRRRT